MGHWLWRVFGPARAPCPLPGRPSKWEGAPSPPLSSWASLCPCFFNTLSFALGSHRLRTAGGCLHSPRITEHLGQEASLEGQLYQRPASAWTLTLKLPRCLCRSEGAARHGGSHLPGGPHCHRLQRPCRLLAAAALGHSLLGLPLPVCRHRLTLRIQSQLQPWPLS